MSKYGTIIGLVTAVLATGVAASETAGPSVQLDPALQPVLLAQYDEGDVDESFDAYGEDVDEVLEEDELLMSPTDTTKQAPPERGLEEIAADLVKGITWFGHASFMIENGKRIYLDPYDLPAGVAKADLILITHDHGDHFSRKDIDSIITPSTEIVSIRSVIGKIGKDIKNLTEIAAGDTVRIGEIEIEAVPAYNIKKDYHPKSKGYVGFIIRTTKRSIYHAGDTDLIPEMKGLDVDVAMLPIGGKYTMDATDAAEAANLIKPAVAIPMHWGKIIGTAEDAEAFKAKSKVPVIILKETQKETPKPSKPSGK